MKERIFIMNNISDSVSSALAGTKTLENLKRAFEKEAEHFARESIYSALASQEGNSSAWKALGEMADNDRRHAELWLGYLDELGDTYENLESLAAMKSVMTKEIYPVMADIAYDEGFEEIAEKMRLASAVKSTHKDILGKESERITAPESLYSDNPETLWHCTSCGYNIKGNRPPERCPLCSYPASCYARM